MVAECGSPTQAKELLPGLADGTLPASLVVPTGRPDGSAVPRPGLTGGSGDDGSLTVDGIHRARSQRCRGGPVLAPVAVAGAVQLGPARAGRVGPGRGPAQLRSVPALGRLGARRGPWCRRSGSWTAPPPSGSVSWPCWWPRPRRWEGPAGASTPRPSTPAPASSSAGPSGSSKGSSTAWPTCWSRWSRGWPPPGTPPSASMPGPWGRGTGPGGGRLTPGPRAGWPSLAAGLALDGYVEAAKGAIQVLGGMGFTWEHDAHIHLRRATTLRQLVGGTAPLRAEAARLALAGRRRALTVELPPEAEELRAELQPRWWPPSPPSRTRSSSGGPWPSRVSWRRTGRPRGDATPVPSSSWSSTRSAPRPGSAAPTWPWPAWALPTIMAHGTPEQTERWVGPTLRGELLWCQLFSEPGAGSDLAALTTRATRVEGGWGSTARRCGPRWRPGPTWASAWPAPTPTCPSTGASPTSWWT